MHGAILMVSLAEAVKHEDGKTQIMLQTERGHRQWYEEMAAGKRTKSIYDIVETLCDPDLLAVA